MLAYVMRWMRVALVLGAIGAATSAGLVLTVDRWMALGG